MLSLFSGGGPASYHAAAAGADPAPLRDHASGVPRYRTLPGREGFLRLGHHVGNGLGGKCPGGLFAVIAACTPVVVFSNCTMMVGIHCWYAVDFVMEKGMIGNFLAAPGPGGNRDNLHVTVALPHRNTQHTTKHTPVRWLNG